MGQGWLPPPPSRRAEWDPQTGAGGCTLVVPSLGVPHRQKLFLHGSSKRQLLKGAGSALAGIACAPALLFWGGYGVQAVGPGPLMPHGITPGLWAPPGTWKAGWGAEMTQLGWHSPASSRGGCTVSPQPGWGVGAPAAPRAGGAARRHQHQERQSRVRGSRCWGVGFDLWCLLEGRNFSRRVRQRGIVLDGHRGRP